MEAPDTPSIPSPHPFAESPSSPMITSSHTPFNLQNTTLDGGSHAGEHTDQQDATCLLWWRQGRDRAAAPLALSH